MDDGYERTISGLLRKRNEVLTEVFAIRERQGVLTNDLRSIERVLQTLGYEGNLDIGDRPPVRSRMILFHRTELQQHVLQMLQKADKPLTSRD